jgi:all-trans-retinol 13,14-reductase
VNRQFIESAWRFVNGSQQLADAFGRKIETAGGILLNRSEVVEINTQNLKNSYVTVGSGERFYAKNIISNIHPSKTLQMLVDARVKPVYRKRILNLPNTTSFFGLFIVFKPQSFPYLNRNYYHYTTDEVWYQPDAEKAWPNHFMFYTGCLSQEQVFAENGTVLTQMSYKEVEQWAGTQKAMRGDDYEAFKTAKSEALIEALNQKFPGIKNQIQSWYAATPLSFEHYTNTPEGTAYGILKDHQNPYKSIILPKTKIPNLFFTGQNLNMHGALGVTIGAVLTSAELVGLDYLVNKIRNSI